MNNSDKFLDKLFHSARTLKPDTSQSEFAFETRLAARIREMRGNATPSFLAVAWRVIPFFCLIVIGLGAWNVAFPPADGPTDLYSALSNELTENIFVQVLAGS